MKHVFYKCPQPCGQYHCIYCDGGLMFCIICKCGEGELEPECPGPPNKTTESTSGDE